MTTVTIKGIEFEGPAKREPAGTIKVGDRVKLLQKKYNDEYSAVPGIVVAIDCFESLPTVVIMYAEYSYNGPPELKFAHFNEKSKGDVEVLRLPDEEANFGAREDAVEMFDRAERDLRQKLADLQIRREFFTRKFAVAFSTVARDLKQGAPEELA